MMKIRIYSPEEASEKVITIPIGFLFSRLGIYLASRMVSSQARKEYDKKVTDLWKAGDLDDMISPEDIENAEKLPPPITAEEAKELLRALRDSRYLMGGLPLLSIDNADGLRLRVDL